MIKNLSERSFDCLIENREISKLIYLTNTNIITDNQKKIIYTKLSTDRNFINDACEKYYDSIETFKYRDNILTLFILMRDFEDFKTRNFINNIFDHDHDEEYQGNDEIFMWFIFNNIYKNKCSSKNNDKEYRIIYECHNVKKKDICVNKCSFSSNMEKYFRLFKGADFYNENILTKNKCNIISNDLIFRNDICDIKLSRDNRLLIIHNRKICTFKRSNIWIKSYICIYFFIHDDLYYIGDYSECKRVICDYYLNIRDEYISEDPFIKSASKNLNEILPILNGEVISKLSYSGEINNGEYVKINFNNNDLKLHCYDFYSIVKEISTLWT